MIILTYKVINLQDGDNWANSHKLTFSGIDSSYSLPKNVAVITLQVIIVFCLVRSLASQVVGLLNFNTHLYNISSISWNQTYFFFSDITFFLSLL